MSEVVYSLGEAVYTLIETNQEISKSQRDWDIFWLQLCVQISKKSKDRSTKIGSIVVSPDNKHTSMGWNGFPTGIKDDEEYYHTRPTKYQITAHAEQNALDNCIFDVKGWTLYVSCGGPCTGCTRSIIQKGIRRIVHFDGKFEGKGSHWESDLELSRIMLNEVGIITSTYPKTIFLHSFEGE